MRRALLLVFIAACGPEPIRVDHGDSEDPVTITAIPRASVWRYWDRGGDLGSAWRGVFDDSMWPSGQGPLGYGESYLGTTIGFGPTATDKFVTSYFRHTFTVDDPEAITAITGELMFDDGAVVYLNGARIERVSMPPGRIDASTLARGHEAENRYRRFDWSNRQGLLVRGTNVIAVEVHQTLPTSADLVFDLALHFETALPELPETLVDRRSEWRYWDRPEEPAPFGLWKFPEHDDSAWTSGPGPLGYGERYIATPVSSGPDPRNKQITTYFRHEFDVAEVTAQTRLVGEVMYDDGAVVYLNGNEIARLHMPAGAILPTTLSDGHETGNQYELFDWSTFVGHLVPGPNVLAVEVHQVAPTSSDLTFDLGLRADTPEVCAIPGCGPAAAPPPGAALNGIWVAPDSVWAVGAAGAIGRRTEAENEWCWCAPAPMTEWRAVWGTADDDVWIVGDDGAVLHYDGVAFTTVDVGATAALTDVWGSGPDDIFVVGDLGTVRRFDGMDWSAHDLAADQRLDSAWGASADDVWIGGSEPAPFPGNPAFDGRSSVIYRWQPATGTWLLEARYTQFFGFADIAGIHGTSADNLFAVGALHPAGAASAQSQAVHNDGTGWTRVTFPCCLDGDRLFADVVTGAPGGTWIVGGRSALRNDGTGWVAVDPDSTQGLLAIDYRGDRLWAAGLGLANGPHQIILRWDGSRWLRSW